MEDCTEGAEECQLGGSSVMVVSEGADGLGADFPPRLPLSLPPEFELDLRGCTGELFGDGVDSLSGYSSGRTSAFGPKIASTIGKNSNPSIKPSSTSASSSLKNSLATNPNSLVASMEAARAAAIVPCTTGANTDSRAKDARRRLQPIEVTKAKHK